MFKLIRVYKELLLTNYEDSTLLLAGVTRVKKIMLSGWNGWRHLYVYVTRVTGQTTAYRGKTLCPDQVTQWTLHHNLLLWACKWTPLFQNGPITAIVVLSLTSKLTRTYRQKMMDEIIKGRKEGRK